MSEPAAYVQRLVDEDKPPEFVRGKTGLTHKGLIRNWTDSFWAGTTTTFTGFELDLVVHLLTKEKCMKNGLDEVFPPTPQVWAELAQHLMAGNHQLGKAVGFLEEVGADPRLLAERLDIKVDYAAWLLTHARKMKDGIIRVVVSDKNDGRESASIQAHHYRYLLDKDLTPEARHYVETVIAKFRTVNRDISMKAAKAQGAQDSHERELRSEPALCTNPDCEWAWTRHGGQCS